MQLLKEILNRNSILSIVPPILILYETTFINSYPAYKQTPFF